jgi:arginyl-tRNA--protein-N-Asp/Glu arginylyltransferase
MEYLHEGLLKASPQSLLSVVSPRGHHSHSCGYCKGSTKGQSTALYIEAKQMSVVDYQALIDLGWRRSGHQLYLPVRALPCFSCLVDH